MGTIRIYMTATWVSATPNRSGAREEHGYIDPAWSLTDFQDSREAAGPVMSIEDDDPDLGTYVRDALDNYLGSWHDNKDGTFYGQDETVDDNGDSWTYALHFVRVGKTDTGRLETPWPVTVHVGGAVT